MDSLESEDVLLIDGHCGTCSKLGAFLNRRTSRKTPLKIIAQQEDLGIEVFSALPIEIQEIDSVIFFEIGILPSSGTPNLSLSSIPPPDLNKSTL